MRAVPYLADRRVTIPLTVISGPAGSGKTALLRHMMDASVDRRVVGVVRDLAPLLVDTPADVRRDGARVTWPNGCVAIASDDPTATLTVIARDSAPVDHVIVEADATRNPRRVTGYGYMPGYRPDGAVMVVDACVVNDDLPVDVFDTAICSQLRAADLVVLNKLDAAGHAVTATAQRSLARIAPAARFLWSRRGHVAPDLLLGSARQPGAAGDLAIVAEWRADYMPVRPRERKTFVGEQCQVWRLVADTPLEARDFRAWVTRLPPSIVRGAGTVHLAEEPQHRYEFSLIGARWDLARQAPWRDGEESPSTRLSLVGIGAGQAGAADEDGAEPAARGDEPMSEDDLSRMVM